MLRKKNCVSFTATHQGLHHVKVQVKGIDIPCNPCTIQVVPTINAIHKPTAIATTTSGLLVVAGTTSIAVMDKEGHVISSSNSQGGGYNTGICVTPDNHILVVSSKPPHITKYAMDCTLVSTADTNHGSRSSYFAFPQSIAVSTSGHVYVCDAGNHRIQVFSSEGRFITKFGTKGDGDGQLNDPHGLALTPEGNIIVADFRNNRVQLFGQPA